MVGGTWQSFALTKDDTTSDRDLLRLKSSDIVKIEGYVPHELMAVALVVEYEVGIPSQQRTQNNAQTILQSAGATLAAPGLRSDDWGAAAAHSMAAAAETPGFTEFDPARVAAAETDVEERTGSGPAVMVADGPRRDGVAAESDESEGRWCPAERTALCALVWGASVVAVVPTAPSEPTVSAAAMAGMATIAAPTPSANASAPTRPT